MTAHSDPAQRTSIDPATSIGAVRLTVADLTRSRAFYEQVLGLAPIDQDNGTLAFGSDREHPLVELHGDSNAPALDRHATGLFHLAVLLPTRRDLALALGRLAQSRWPLDGASDHLVSEALYLSDPDGNGIEIYRDRPRDQWPRTDGRIQMATLPLDLRNLMGELESEERRSSVPPETTIGHVHLQVADLGEAEAFYSGILGFDVIVRGYPGALFVSAGGYHHHLGLNTWNSAGASPPRPGSVGLRSFDVVLPNADALDHALKAVQAAGLEPVPDDGGVVVRDPSGNAARLTAATGA